jgi:hypothetical protein
MPDRNPSKSEQSLPSPRTKRLSGASAKRKFFRVTRTSSARGSGFELLNGSAPFRDMDETTFSAPPGRRGFMKYSEISVFLADERLGPIHQDFQVMADFFLISERMKGVIEPFDGDAFAFLPCEVRMRDGGNGPTYRLCDIICVLDALDEKQSEVSAVTADDGTKIYNLLGQTKLIFKESAIGNRHMFRMMFSEDKIICDDSSKLLARTRILQGCDLSTRQDVMSRQGAGRGCMSDPSFRCRTRW